MKRLSPQKELILSYLRSGKWVCGSAWLGQIKDDRKRISELNEGYMRVKGYEIQGEACKGRVCGKHYCPLFMRRAVRKTVTIIPKRERETIRAEQLQLV